MHGSARIVVIFASAFVLSVVAACSDDEVRDAFAPSPTASDASAHQHASAEHDHSHAHHENHGQQPSHQTASPADSHRSGQRPPDDPTVASFLGLRGPKPATWVWHPAQSPMVHTNYTAPGVDGSKAAHINVYFFGEGMGGPISANIERWQGQFRSPDGYAVEPIVDEFEVNGLPVTLVELEGEYMGMGQSWFTPNQLFLTAIVDGPVGRVFIRFVGQSETVEHHRDAYMKLIRNLEVEREQDATDDPGSPY